MIDASLDRLHEVVSAKLTGHPVLAELVEEAEGDGEEVSELTRQQVELALTAAARKDDAFGQAVTELVARLEKAEQASGRPVIAGPGLAVFTGNAGAKAASGGIAVGQVAGGCTLARGCGTPPSRGGSATDRTRPHAWHRVGGRAQVARSRPCWHWRRPIGTASWTGHGWRDGDRACWASQYRPGGTTATGAVGVPGAGAADRAAGSWPGRGRDAELAELARFCLAPDGCPYAWWRAGPWAGKSALLSTFVLRPPAEVAGRVGSCRSSSPRGWPPRTPGRHSPRCCWSSWPTCWASPCRTVLPEATRDAYLLGLMSRGGERMPGGGQAAGAGGRRAG